MAVEGPVIEWVATHRKHHRFSDLPGDPHSPHRDQAPGWRGALRGLAHAHVGWIFRGKDMANPARYAKDLLADRDLRFISRTFPLWVAVGLALPVRPGRGADGLARRRPDRAPVGRGRADLPPSSRDLQHQLALPLLRPPAVLPPATSHAISPGWRRSLSGRPGTTTTTRSRLPPVTGSGRWQLDPGAWLITGLERCHLAWDVVRISAARQETRRATLAGPAEPR